MNGPKSRLAQSANSAAIVVILIAVLIILYILFLSPEDRAALLGEDVNGGTTGPGTGQGSGLLYSKTPGRIYPAGRNVIEHTMPSFLVFTVTNANELKRTDSLYVKNSAFSDSLGDVSFFYDPRTTNDLKLSFNVRSHTGMLRISLNGNQIYEGEVNEGSPLPISLAKEYLVQGKNTITFSSSEPGAAFWRVNDYQLENVLISARVTDYSGATSEQHFSVTDNEYETMQKAVLEFLPDCPPREEGQVQILLNTRPIYASVPDCGIRTSIEISKDFLKAGDNILVATTSTGSFLMDAPKVTTYLKDTSQPVFYFNAPAALLDSIFVGQRGLMLTLRFADADKVKRGTIEINGYKMYFETQNYIYQTPLDPEALAEGPNSIRILPQSDPMDIVELRVDVI